MTASPTPDYLNLEPGLVLGGAAYVGNLEDGSDAWHAQRSTVIGSSEVASIVGVPAFRSKYTLWLEKAGFYTPAEPGEETQELFDWGHELEPAIASSFHKKYPTLTPVRTGSWVSTTNSWHGVNPDYLLVDEEGRLVGILECKYSMNGAGWENDSCPHKYVVQLRYQLQAFGLREGYLAAFYNGKLLVFRVTVNATEPVENMRTGSTEWFSWGGEEMLPVVQEFMDSLPQNGNAGTPPEIDGHTETMDYIKKRHPEIDGTDVEVSWDMADEYAGARVELAAAEERYNTIKACLLMEMGTAKRAMYGGKAIARRQATKGSPSLYANGKPYFPPAPQIPPAESEVAAADTEMPTAA